MKDLKIFIFNAEQRFALVIGYNKEDAVNLLKEADIFKGNYIKSNATIDLEYGPNDLTMFNHCTELDIKRGVTVFYHGNE